MTMSNQHDRVAEKHRRALMDYHAHIKPLLESMTQLVILWRRSRWTLIQETGEVQESAYVWANQDAEALYHLYEGYIDEIWHQYFSYIAKEGN